MKENIKIPEKKKLDKKVILSLERDVRVAQELQAIKEKGEKERNPSKESLLAGIRDRLKNLSNMSSSEKDKILIEMRDILNQKK